MGASTADADRLFQIGIGGPVEVCVCVCVCVCVRGGGGGGGEK